MKNNRKFSSDWKTGHPVLPLIAAFGLFVLAAGLRADTWTRSMADIGTRPADSSEIQPLELAVISGRDDDVYGLCVLYNPRPAVVAIEGMETLDGEFHPSATLQVANDTTGEWRTVDAAPKCGARSTLIVQAKQASKSLIVELNALRPMIREFRFGKILLESGESVNFELAKLLPPKEGE